MRALPVNPMINAWKGSLVEVNKAACTALAGKIPPLACFFIGFANFSVFLKVIF